MQGVAARAVLFYATGDASFNTTVPTGALANSGWQYQGAWGSYLGTPIAPQYFITAHHIGGSIGAPFVYNGASYTTTAFFDDPNSDLRIWRVCGTFPSYAMVYTNTNEAGNGLVVFGRGTQRGSAVSVSAGGNGWLWGTSDGVERWGENTVGTVVDGDQLFSTGGSVLGSLLQVPFDMNGGANEATLSVGDSGGGVFIQDGSVWKLAGINYGVDGFFNTSTNGTGFSAAIFDARGLYEGEEGNWTLVPPSPRPVPSSFYATRISSNLNWILSIISPAVPDDLPVLQSAAGAGGPYADNPGAAIDPQARTITIPLPAQAQFYRLRACVPLAITSVGVASGNLVLTYGSP